MFKKCSKCGIWTTKDYNTIDISGLENFINLIHLADYCASRKIDDIYATLQEEKQNDISMG